MPKKISEPKKTKLKKKTGHKKKFLTPAMIAVALVAYSVIISVAFAVLLWRVITYDNAIVPEYSEAPKLPIASGTAISAFSQHTVGVPLRIKIPSIGVDAAIERVGLNTDGSMGVPTDPMNTGWYELGPRPGEIGSAVIDGHVDWWYGAPAVFPNLKKVKVGDKIIVQDEYGANMSFVVRKTQNYGATDDATSVFISKDRKSHLNLITCTGAWDNRSNQYSKRLVVFADKE